jgi:replicative DNA helicase
MPISSWISAAGAKITAELEASLTALSLDGDDKDAFTSKSNVVSFAVERAELGEAQGISTGFARVDAMIGGFRPKLYLLGAASSMGKTTLVSAIARNVASQGFGVVEFMLEMDEIEDGLRTAAALAFVRDHKIQSPHYLTAQRGMLTADQRAMMRAAAQSAGSLPILTDYRQGRTLSQIEASARRGLARLRKQGNPPGLVVIDHEGLIAPERGARFGSQLEATNARAIALLGLPDRLGAPVLVTGQLTKDGKRADGEERWPSTDDWKYGGALIEAAHAVMLLHRPAYYAARKPEKLRSPADWEAIKSREATVIVDKARGGSRGRAAIWMDMPTAAVWEEAA